MAKSGIFSAIILALTFSSVSLAENSAKPMEPQTAAGSEPTIAPYLREDAPVFMLTAAQFREKFNTTYPHMALAEYQSIKTLEVKSPLTRAASRINSTLYSSVALDKNKRTIRSLQLTYIPALPTEEKAEKPETLAKVEKYNRATLTNYIAAFINLLEPTLTAEKSQHKAIELLEKGKGTPFYQQTEGTLRFVIADHNEKGITFAIEPIKLSLSDK
ncbi:DUF1454 family protein [Budvicia diplopodorum]|uniref:DUF1454 family protein n=1 Tax=Budvicia diplopodorum TaxID=1119056 RepID=UPI00135C2F04|nr:DUF1454 family protein [Budvicia diplopodorum]